MPTENRSSNTEMVSVQATIESLEEAYAGDSALGFMNDAAQLLRQLKAISTLQPHPEPIAWMVGTAIWWTKEEAERDAAATGLPIVELGPMAAIAPAQQHHGTPVGEVVAFGKGLHEIAWATGRLPSLGAKLYTHADPAEVERIKAELVESDHAFVRMASEAEKLRAQLEERDALLREIADHCNGCVMPTEQLLRDRGSSIDAALSASAEPQVKA